MNTPKVLILGGGFGGVYSYLNLLKKIAVSEVEVTVVNNSEDFTFTPMVAEYLTGEISLVDIQQPLRKILNPKHCKLHIATVISINYEQQLVTTSKDILSYDYLIIALGSSVNFHGIEGAQQNTLVLRSATDATMIVDHIRKNLNLASHSKDAVIRDSLATVAIVGAGPTGVELAAKISDLAIVRAEPTVNIQLIDTSDYVLQFLPDSLRLKAAKILTQKSVAIKMNTLTVKIRAGILYFSDGTSLAAGTVIWTAGVKPVIPTIIGSKTISKTGQILVDRHLRVLGHPNAFAIGDIAAVETIGQSLPAAAQVAVAESKTVAINIARMIHQKGSLRVFEYKSRGTFIPLGRWTGVGRLGNHNISGPVVCLGWKLVYVWRFPYTRRRFLIALHWVKQLIQ